MNARAAVGVELDKMLAAIPGSGSVVAWERNRIPRRGVRSRLRGHSRQGISLPKGCLPLTRWPHGWESSRRGSTRPLAEIAFRMSASVATGAFAGMTLKPG
jgi:hypothetical protein